MPWYARRSLWRGTDPLTAKGTSRRRDQTRSLGMTCSRRTAGRRRRRRTTGPGCTWRLPWALPVRQLCTCHCSRTWVVRGGGQWRVGEWRHSEGSAASCKVVRRKKNRQHASGAPPVRDAPSTTPVVGTVCTARIPGHAMAEASKTVATGGRGRLAQRCRAMGAAGVAAQASGDVGRESAHFSQSNASVGAFPGACQDGDIGERRNTLSRPRLW